MTREPGQSHKVKGGGKLLEMKFFHNHFMSTYYRVKAHLLALPSCGISACTHVSLAKRKEMEREAFVGVENVTEKEKKKIMMTPFHS